MCNQPSPAMLEQIAAKLESDGKSAWATEIRLAASENKRLEAELRRLQTELEHSATRIEKILGVKNAKG